MGPIVIRNTMPLKGSKKQKIAKELKKFKEGELHSGSAQGPVVTNPKQAIAISLSEAGLSKKKKKKKVKKKQYWYLKKGEAVKWLLSYRLFIAPSKSG